MLNSVIITGEADSLPMQGWRPPPYAPLGTPTLCRGGYAPLPT